MSSKPNTFLEYLQTDRFYDKFYNRIFAWCCSNKSFILDRLDGYDVSYIANIEEDIELEYKNVWINNKNEDEIDFDVAMEVTVNVEGVYGKHRDRDAFTARFWLIIYCHGSMNKRLSDFRISGLEEFISSRPQKPLSGDFIPYIKKDKYDDYANEILDKYYFNKHPEARNIPIAIDVDELASEMHLRIVNRPISKDRNIFGQIYFDDSDVKLYNAEKDSNEVTHIDKDTILVDEESAYLRSYGSRNMTVAHECIHSYYHRKAFLFAKMMNENLNYIQCQVNGVMKNGEDNSTANWMEIQANGLAPYILMPKSSFEPFAHQLFKEHYQEGTDGIKWIEDVIKELATTYEVTIYAVRKRLIDLGFELAIGAFNWVDDHYVRPYSFKHGSLQSNETFTANYKDIYLKAIRNPSFTANTVTSAYVFVENHLCVNSPKYLTKDANGDLILTDYALTHMEECCVKFKYKTIQGFGNNSEFGLMCYLCRDCSKELEFDLELANDPSRVISDDDFRERYSIHLANVDEVCDAIRKMSFGEIIKYLMDYLDYREDELSYDSGLSKRTIGRYINNENKVPDKRTVVALLRTLNVPFQITSIAIKQAGINFITGKAEDDALLSVLTLLRNGSAEDANRFMNKLGFDNLTKFD